MPYINIEQVRETVLKAIAVNQLNTKGQITDETARLLTKIDIDIRNYILELQGKRNVAGVEIDRMEKKIVKQFTDMTSSIMELVKIKEHNK